MQLQSLELLQPTVQEEIHFQETARMNVRPRAWTDGRQTPQLMYPFLQEKAGKMSI